MISAPPVGAPARRPTRDQREATRRPRILLAVTVDQSLRLLDGFPHHLAERGWEVHVVSSPGPRLARLELDRTLDVHPLTMSRHVAPVQDAAALVRWVRLLAEVKPDVVCVGTPKAGLLGGLAGLLTRVPQRLFLLRGLRSETLAGPAGRLVALGERLSASCAHQVICVSPSLRSAAVRSGVVRDGAAVVLGSGSSNGVCADATPVPPSRRRELRRGTFAEPDRFTLGYVGRVTRDKGLDTLAAALARLSASGVRGNCLVVGGDDSDDSPALRAALDESGWSVAHTGALDDALPRLATVDALCLPSRREGFPNVVLEAAILGIPTIGSDATGVVDAIVDEVTGLVVATDDPVALAEAISTLERDPARCARLGGRARQRAVEEFARPRVWERHERFFRALLHTDEGGRR